MGLADDRFQGDEEGEITLCDHAQRQPAYKRY